MIVLADPGFSGVGLIAALRRHACLVTRLRIDASLFAPAPPRRPGQRGRPRLKGRRLPALKAVLADPNTVWSRVSVAQWHGGRSREIEVASGTAVWYYSGLPPAPIRWLLVRDPSAGREPQAFLSTDLAATPERILGWFVSRWRRETAFQEVHTHLGVQTQRQCSDLAILRTTPALLGLFSLVTVWADELARAPSGAVPEPPPGMISASRPSATPSPRFVALYGARRVYPCPARTRKASKSPPPCCNGSQTPSATLPETRKVGLNPPPVSRPSVAALAVRIVS